jgi:pimeloyl-ACP methyl ester carboxylesterase
MGSFVSWLIAAAATLTLIGAGLALYTRHVARRVESVLPPQGRLIDIDGTRIHYLDEGSGPAVLLIHGLGGQMRNFTHSLTRKLKDEFRVIVLDRPGSGYSIRPADASAAVGAQAGTIARFIEALGLERPLVVGHSLGGAITLALAVNHPGRAGAIALIAPLTQPQRAVPQPFRGLVVKSPALRRIIAWTLATPLSIVRRRIVLETLFGPEPVPADFATKGGGLLSLRPSGFYAASTDLMAVSEDLPALAKRYGAISIPAGILFGTGDRILDYRIHGEGLAAQLPGAGLELVEGGGHMLPISVPDRCAKFIARIASRLSAEAETGGRSNTVRVSSNDA